MVEHWISSADCLNLPILALGQNSNLTSNGMVYLRRQGVAVDDDNDAYPNSIPYYLPQVVNALNFNKKKPFSQYNQTIYTTLMRL